MSEDIKNNPVVRISLTSALGDKAQISFETYVDATVSKDFMDAFVDKLVSVKDRQQGFEELKGLDALIVTETNLNKSLEADLLRLDTMENEKAKAHNSRGNSRLAYVTPAKEVESRRNMVANIEHRRQRLADLRNEAERRREVVGKRHI